MAGDQSSTARTLEYTPTWALATVACVFVIISLAVERSLHSLGHYLRETKRKPLFAALQRLKDELMLMGFISLTITILQDPVSKICVPISAYNQWTPCKISSRQSTAKTTTPPSRVSDDDQPEHRRRLLASASSTSSTCSAGYEPFVSPATLHQLHIFILVLALVHVAYSCLTMLLALIKVYRWRKWENEAHEAVKQATTAELLQSIKYTRQSTFVRYHTSKPWSRSRFIVWMVCFFQQLYIPRADYLALRLSFITTHNLKELYDFHAYMVRSMEDEFETIVGISSWLWAFFVVLWVFNIDGSQLYFWMSIIPVLVILCVGTKLQHVVATLALENTGVPAALVGVLLQPRDQLFWFNRPKLLLSSIHWVLFDISFEFATFIWHVWQFGYDTCLLENNKGYIFGRLAMGFGILLFSSYSTLPLYALVTQMGTSYKKAVLSKHVERVLRQWHKDAKQRLKVNAMAQATEAPADGTAPSSSSLVVHFKSRLTQRIDATRRSPLSSPRNGLPTPGAQVKMEEGTLSSPHETTLPRSPKSPTTAQSIWKHRVRTEPSMEKTGMPSTPNTETSASTSNANLDKFASLHPAFKSRALQRQSSLPIHEIRHS
ncbi:MLO-like protein 14 [Physcomitrium patens]|uniref:MLO-like protein n=1 Tax=Physcomitrium patens TaxID=3218 RepID=A0A2K1KPT6_PHYPA|nr:MLO-like protein 14 [Physcomitrium patens]PNR55804.1 hypothetical protein PHYPA_006701 [Physcomitrium patens]|eukprot:XP_024373337.1 MLO-like protein 14 [Physcomitrella patens]